MRDISKHYCITVQEEGSRLDVFLKQVLSQFSRSFLQGLIHQGKVTVNETIKRPSYLLKKGDEVDVTVPSVENRAPSSQPLPVNILFEDEHLIVLNKPGGMATHPVFPEQKGTLVNALLNYTKRLSTVGGPLRPGIVHRLDKDTSGVMVVAKTDSVHLALSIQFRKREVKKSYIALVKGNPSPAQGIIDVKIGRNPKRRTKMVQDEERGREAVSYYRTLRSWGSWSLLEIQPLTGRTHQIRVHLKNLNCFLIGDRLYGGKAGRNFPLQVSRCMLHAKFIGFFHPATRRWVEFEAPIPPDMEQVIDYLRRECR